MDNQSDIFNYYVGGLALISTFASIILYSRTYLPTVQMKVLDALSRETREIYEKSYADGFLPIEFQREVEVRLIRLEAGREELREQTYKAITIFDQYIASVRGLSERITRLSDNVKKLRSLLVTTTEENKRARRANVAALLLRSNQSDNFTVSSFPDSCDITDYHYTSTSLPPTHNDSPQLRSYSYRSNSLITSTEQPACGRSDPDLESITSTLVDRRQTFFKPWTWIYKWWGSRQNANKPSSDSQGSSPDSGWLPV